MDLLAPVAQQRAVGGVLHQRVFEGVVRIPHFWLQLVSVVL
jgi:hypothetical protein